MNTDKKTKTQLIQELNELHRRVAELEQQGAGQAEKALRESEERYRLLFETSLDAIFLTALDGRIFAANPAACHIFGRSETEICRMGRKGLVDTDDPRLLPALEERIRTGSFRGELTFIRSDGSKFSGEVSSALFTDMAGQIRTSLVIRDMTEHKRAEERIRKLNRVYGMLSDVNQAIVRVREMQALFERICHTAVERGGFRMVWIGLFDPYTQVVQPVAHAGVTDGYLEKLRIALDDSPRGQGPTANTLRTSEHTVANDIEHDPRMAPWREDALRLGYRSMATFPLVVGGRVRGVLSLYAAEPGFFDLEELELLDEMAGDVSFALEYAEQEMQRRQTEDALHQSEALFHSLVESLPQNVFTKDRQGQFTFANQRYCATEGKSLDAILGKTDFDLHPDELASKYQADDRRVMETGQILDVIEEHEPSDGNRFFVQVIKSPLYDGQGNVVGILGIFWDITERKQVEEALMLRLEQLSAISQASQAVALSLDVNQVLAEVVSLAGKVTASDYASIVLIDEEGHTSGGFEDLPGVQTIEYRTREKGLTNWIVRTRQPVVVDEIGEGGTVRPRMAARAPRTANPLLVAKGIQSLAGLPLVVKDRIVGVLYLHSLHPDAFHEQLPLLTTFANQAAIAIEKARLYDALQKELTEHKHAKEALEQRAAQLSLINDVSRRVAGVMDLDDLLDTTAALIHESFGYEHVGIFIANRQQEGDLVMKARAGHYASRFPANYHINLGQGMVGWVALYGGRLLANDASAEMRFHDPFGDASIKAELSVPIWSEQGNVGVIDIQSQKKAAFSENDVMVVETLADVLAAAIHNARLYQERQAYSSILEQAIKDRTEELSRTKDHIEAILNSVGEAIIVFGTDGRIQQVNPAFERLTGYRADEVEMHRHDDPQIVLGLSNEIFLQALAPHDGHGWHGEMQVRRRDGTAFDSVVSISSVLDTQGKVVAFVGAMRDISPLKEVERMKDAFVSNVSHELRTPITSLKLFHHLLQANPAKQSRYLEHIGREIQRLNVLIEDLLRLSRLDQGRVEMSISPVNLSALVAQYIADFTPLAESKQLALGAEGSPDEPTVQADKGLLGQVLSVLLTNALNYTPAGGRVVVTTLTAVQEGQFWGGFSVRDTGPGIPKEELKQLSQRFFRGSAGRTSGIPGTGLGLAIAREIIERHGGRLEVKSTGIPGEGAAFTIWLPVESKMADGREDE